MVVAGVKTEELISSIGAGLCLVDKDFHIVWINQQQADWFGSASDICGKHCYKTFERRKHICRGCPALRVFKTGNIHKARRIGFTHDGIKRYYQLTVSPVKDKDNKVIFALELVQDITSQVDEYKLSRQVADKLKKVYKHAASINTRLRLNMQKLKNAVNNISRLNHILEKKYKNKTKELIAVKEELQEIFKINRSLSSEVTPKKISNVITRLSCGLLHADAALLRIVDEKGKILVCKSSYGLDPVLLKRIGVLRIGESLCGQAVKSKKTVAIMDINDSTRLIKLDLIKKAGYKSLLCVPVIARKKVLGALTLFSNNARHFTNEQVDVLGVFASQIALAMQESKYFDDIHLNYFNTIHALVLAIEARDPYTRGHTERVTMYALEIARYLGMSEEEMEILRYAGEVHDVGKISVPDSILNKPGLLTPTERAMIELHPVKGAEMLEPLEFLKPAIPIVRHHHERYDGTGYPDGLSRDKIPVMARILACADSFDAMTSDRPYRRRKLTAEEALAEIKNNAGSQFDPHIANSFIKAIRKKPSFKALV